VVISDGIIIRNTTVIFRAGGSMFVNLHDMAEKATMEMADD
jgi:hypothetical protein